MFPAAAYFNCFFRNGNAEHGNDLEKFHRRFAGRLSSRSGNGVKEIEKNRCWSLENDHIFPRGELERRNITHDVNDVGNFRLLPKLPNIKKSDTMPTQDTEFFGKEDPELKQLYELARHNLTQPTFSAFVECRRNLIREKVTIFLGMT